MQFLCQKGATNFKCFRFSAKRNAAWYSAPHLNLFLGKICHLVCPGVARDPHSSGGGPPPFATTSKKPSGCLKANSKSRFVARADFYGTTAGVVPRACHLMKGCTLSATGRPLLVSCAGKAAPAGLRTGHFDKGAIRKAEVARSPNVVRTE